MSISKIADNIRQRQKIASNMRIETRVYEVDNVNITCGNCGFKVRYKVIRCPICESENLS